MGPEMAEAKLIKKTLEYIVQASFEDGNKQAHEMAEAMSKLGKEVWIVGYVTAYTSNNVTMTQFSLVVHYP